MTVSAPTRRTGVVAAVASAISFGAAFVVVRIWMPFPPGLSPHAATLIHVKLLLSTFTALLLVALLINYARLYRRIPNRFTVALILFTVLLGLHAIASNPLVPLLFGFRVVDVGPFTFLPDLFASCAVLVLLRQSLN